MSDDELRDDARAIQLLPPAPAVAPERRIAERRVVGWDTSIRLANRVARRPAGNSRRFWRRVEEDDPFLPPPGGPRPTDEAHAMYPLERVPRPAAPAEPAPRSASPPPKPSAPAPAAKANQPVLTPDSRVAAAPSTGRSPPAPAATPPTERRLPPKLPPPVRQQPGSWSARNAAAQQQPTRPAAPAAASPTKNVAAPTAPPRAMGIDRAMQLIEELKIAQQEHAQREAEAAAAGLPPRQLNQPRPAAPAPRPTPPPAPRPSPPRAPPPPPAARDEEADLPPPPKVSSQGKLDDLFGGGPQEGRVRIGKPVKKGG